MAQPQNEIQVACTNRPNPIIIMKHLFVCVTTNAWLIGVSYKSATEWGNY